MDTNETDALVREYLSSGVLLSTILPRFQRRLMAWDIKIEPNFGCHYVANLPRSQPNDVEIANGVKRFTFICMRAYVSCLKRSVELRTEPLKSSGKFPMELCVEFYEGSFKLCYFILYIFILYLINFASLVAACNCLMAMPETKKSLKQIYEETRRPPTARVMELQRTVFPWLGYEADYGVKCLERSQSTIAEDPPRMQKQQMFLVCGDLAVKESMMSPEQRKAFYAEIPITMHNSPHIYVVHKHNSARAAHQQHIARNPAANSSHAPMDRGTFPAEGLSKQSPEELAAALSNAEIRSKMESLQARISSLKAETAAEVADWTAAQREDFFAACDQDSKITDMSNLAASGAGGPMAQLNAFMSMSDIELRNFVKLQAVLMNDYQAGGVLGTRMATLQRQAQDLQSSAAMTEAHTYDSHDGHSHVHNSHCSHDEVAAQYDNISTSQIGRTASVSAAGIMER